tara:strand:+ start:1299 stop:1730 length:432 start_codon:yes stop_codon:yes gene_type:complete
MKNLILLLTLLLTSTIITSQTWSKEYKKVYKKSYKKIETFLLKEGYEKSYNKTVFPKSEAGEYYDEFNSFNYNVIFTKNNKSIYIIVTDKYEQANSMAYVDWYFNFRQDRKYDEEFDFDLVNFKTTLAGNVKVSNEIFVIKGE